MCCSKNGVNAFELRPRKTSLFQSIDAFKKNNCIYARSTKIMRVYTTYSVYIYYAFEDF